MTSSLLALGLVLATVLASLLVWTVVTAVWDGLDGPRFFVRFAGGLALLGTLVAAALAPEPVTALVVGLVVTGVVVLVFGALA